MYQGSCRKEGQQIRARNGDSGTGRVDERLPDTRIGARVVARTAVSDKTGIRRGPVAPSGAGARCAQRPVELKIAWPIKIGVNSIIVTVHTTKAAIRHTMIARAVLE